MHKMKKLLITLTVVLVFTTHGSNVQAKTSTQSSLVKLDNPMENIKTVPILGYKLIYMVQNSSVLDFLEKDRSKMILNLKSLGITAKNFVILFLNYGVSKNNIRFGMQTNMSTPSIINTSGYKTKDGIVLNLNSLLKEYTLPSLIVKRSVLIGVLVTANLIIPKNNFKYKTLIINNENAKLFQYIKKQSTLPSKKKKKKDFKNINIQYAYGSSYKRLNLIKQRLGMLSYMNLSIFKKIRFTGMIEMYDMRLHLFNYIALPEAISKSVTAQSNNTQVLKKSSK